MAVVNASIIINNVNKVYYTAHGKVTALQDINVTIGDGEFFTIVGPSGCGKTTLLRILAGLDEASSGELLVNSKDPNRPLNSMVFQEQSVFPWMTVQGN